MSRTDWTLVSLAVIVCVLALAASAFAPKAVEDSGPDTPGSKVVVLKFDGTEDYTYIVGLDGCEYRLAEPDIAEAPPAAPYDVAPLTPAEPEPVAEKAITVEDIKAIVEGRAQPTPEQKSQIRDMVIDRLILDNIKHERRIAKLEAQWKEWAEEPAPSCDLDLKQAPVISPPIDSPFILDENGTVQQVR